MWEITTLWINWVIFFGLISRFIAFAILQQLFPSQQQQQQEQQLQQFLRNADHKIWGWGIGAGAALASAKSLNCDLDMFENDTEAKYGVKYLTCFLFSQKLSQEIFESNINCEDTFKGVSKVSFFEWQTTDLNLRSQSFKRNYVFIKRLY